jgi:hypothetical protein
METTREIREREEAENAAYRKLHKLGPSENTEMHKMMHAKDEPIEESKTNTSTTQIDAVSRKLMIEMHLDIIRRLNNGWSTKEPLTFEQYHIWEESMRKCVLDLRYIIMT